VPFSFQTNCPYEVDNAQMDRQTDGRAEHKKQPISTATQHQHISSSAITYSSYNTF